MRKFVELKIEETKTIVGGTKAAAASSVPVTVSNPNMTLSSNPYAAAGQTAAPYKQTASLYM
jgi:hypothetical protein